jgi:hypothetical protein
MSTKRKNSGASALLLTLYFRVVSNFEAKKLKIKVHKCVFPHFKEHCFLGILATNLPSIMHDCSVHTRIEITFTVILCGKRFERSFKLVI